MSSSAVIASLPNDLEARAAAALSRADDEQRRMMDERVILTDYYDRPIGAGSKRESAFP